MIEYKLIRSKRKTLSIHVKPDGKVEVRAPLKASKPYIDRFVASKYQWIGNTIQGMSEIKSRQETIRLTLKEEKECCEKAVAYFQHRCSYFADKMGIQYEKIRVNKAKTRWGSCNSRGSINFTYRLMFAPVELIDYVIVHELAHRKEMNHSSRFWKIVEETMPDYRIRRKGLKEFQRQYEFIIEG